MTETLHVLIVEDLPTDAELSEREIQKALGACEFRRVETREAYLAAVDEFRPGLIVSDFKLPTFDGLTALEIALERCPEVPFIIVTGSMNEETAVQCMKAGAWDYVIKEHVKRLGPAVQAALEQQRVRAGHRRTEAALRESEVRLREAQRLARMGHWEFDRETQKIRWSDMVFTIYGRDPELGLPTPQEEAAYYSAEDARLLRDCAVSTLETGQPYGLDVSATLPDGRRVDVVVTGSAVKDAQGRISRLLGTVQDVTETRQLQARLAQADRLSTMGTLAAGVAHEINNPLLYVLYNLESLSEDLPRLAEAMRRCQVALCARLGPDAVRELLGADQDLCAPAALDDVAERLRDALSGTIRIREIARGLGTFSRVEDTTLAPIHVHETAERAIAMALHEIKYRARVVKDFGAVPLVLGSDGKLAQVFLNLLINAAHAIEEGHVEDNEILVRTWAEDDHVFAEVSDTGKGIAPEHRQRIFDPFFTTKAIGVGTGLGLSICKNLVTSLGGEISFTSEVGKGTRFLIRLPCMPGEATPPLETPRGERAARSPHRGRVLVVDDEPAIRGAIVRMLGREHEMVAVSSGAEAQALLEKDRRFDVVFCDLMMPRMSGMDLHAWIAERDRRLADKVVFITGGAFTPEAAEYLARVENLRVEKPFDPTGFMKLTDERVRASREEREE